MKKINLKALVLIIASVALIMSCFMIFSFADENDTTDAMIEINADETLKAAFVKKMRMENDGYIGIPVELSIYYDYETHGKATPVGHLDPDGDAVVLYVVNTNVERIGTKSDVEIIKGLLERGYVVAVADYFNSAKAVSPALDWSAQGIRESLYKGEYFSDISDKVGAGKYVTNFILPAGYDVTAYQVFWEIDKHSADGTIEKIVENWNTDFRSSQQKDKLVYWCDENGNRKATWNAPDGSSAVWLNASGKEDANGSYIKLKYTKAESIGDCVNPDGTPIDLNLYAHVIYPTNPEEAVPVMNLASCGLYLSSAPTSEDEYCDFTGFLFNGYAGMIYDYLWYPMARQFGVYDGNTKNGAVTGDHMNYALHLWNDKKVNTAAMRYIRHLAVDEAETYNFDTDHMGVIGLSKGSWFDFLGEAELRNYTVDDPENYTADELKILIDTRINAYTPKRYLDGHHGESRYQAGNVKAFTDGPLVVDGGELQPWLLYETTGEEILAFTSYNYTACGTNEEDITEGHVPMFNSHAMNDSFGNAYSTVGPLVSCLNIPTVDFVCDIYHAMAYGPDEHYGVDTYSAQFAFANYFLKNTPISVMYTDPVGNTTGLKINEDILVTFAGTANAEDMLAITLTDSKGNAVSGEWTQSRGGTTWTFSHEPLLGNETYTLTVPASFKGTNGKAMGEAYTVKFKTESESISAADISGNYVTARIPESITSGVKLGFFIADDSYNTAQVYLVSDKSSSTGELVGSVNVSGKGWYELDITDIAVDSLGEELLFLVDAKRSVADAFVYSGMDYSYNSKVSHTSTTVGGVNAVEIKVKDNGGYSVPGYTENVNVFYSNPTTAITNNKLLGTAKMTVDDIGRRFTVTVKVYDTVSRTVCLSLNNTNNSEHKTIDLNAKLYNFKTKAGEWTEYSFEYVVYEPTYGDTVGSKVKTLTIAASPTGDTEMPIYFAATTVKENLTELNVSGAYVSVYDDGYTYKQDSSDEAFLVDGSYYSTFASALTAAGNGKVITLMRNYTVNGISEAFEIGNATSVTVDLNGYSVRAYGASPVNVAAKNNKALSATFKNGTVYLYNNAFIGYASQTAAAAGKDVTVNLENVSISNADNSRLYGFMTEPALTVDAKMNVHVNLTDCDLNVDAYSNINVNFEIFGMGTKNLFVDYTVNGGSITVDSFARAYLTMSINAVEYVADVNGEYTKLVLSKGTPAPAKRLGAYNGIYGEFKLASTDGLSAIYEIEVTENSTKYGVIPDEYLDAQKYPFALFSNSGKFIGAYSVLFGTETGPFTKAKNQNSNNNVWDEANNTYGPRPYASYILMRADYTIGDGEYDWNFAQSQGTTTLDLNGFTIYKTVQSSTKAKTVFPGQAKANTGSGDAYIYPSSFVIENGTIVTNAPLLNMATYGTTYDLTKKVMNYTFNNLNIVAAGGSTATNFLHTIDNASNGTKGPAIFNVEYNDCTFDLRGYETPASETTLFNVNAKESTMLNVGLKVNGGVVKANDFTNFVLTKLDNYYGSNILFGKGENGNYTAIELSASASTAPTGTVITPDGGKVYSKKASDGVTDTYLLSGKLTEYGAVPDEYTDADAYPFLVFANGDFKGAYAYWSDSDSTVNSALERAIELANGASGVGVKVTILLQRDYVNSRGNSDNVNSKFGTFTGELTVDLAGHTLTAGEWMLFNFNGQLVGGKLYNAKITVENGNLHAGNKVIYAVEYVGTTWTENSHGKKIIDVTFKNVTFAQSPSYNTEKVPFLENTKTTQTSPMYFKALYEDCVFDYNNHSSSTGFTMLNFSVASGVKADIIVKGGTLKTTTFNNFNFYKGTSGDSLKFEKNTDGEYMKASLPEDGVITTSGFIASDGKTLNYAHADTVDGRKLYKLISLVTPYGTIPAEKSSLVDYPFAVFKDGEFLGAYKYYADNNDSTVDSALERAKNAVHGANGAGKTVTIYMRRDFVNLEEYGVNSSSKSVGKYDNFAQFGGTLNIDLGGHTLTAGTWMLFRLQAKKVDGAIFDTVINVKNGALHTGNKVIIAVESSSTDYSALGTKVFKVTFENVTFADSPNYSGEKSSIILNNTTNANPVRLNAVFKNCVFDYESHASGTKVTLLDFKKNGAVSLNAEFIGGEYSISTFANYNIATLDPDDVLVFSPNEDGKYMIANVKNGGAITTLDYKTKDGKTYNFGLMNYTAVIDTYVLMDLNTEYGKIPYQYANAEKYPFVVFDKNGFVHATDIFYGEQSGSSAIGKAIYSVTAASNNWVNGTYGENANYAIILMRADYTIGSSERFANLAHNQGNITIDLGGHTLTAAADNYMFAATIKRWPTEDSKDTNEIFPTFYTVKNGTLVSVNKALLAFDTMSSTTVNLLEKTFSWHFVDVTFKNIGSAANPFIACFYKTGIAKVPTPVTYTNCTFDLSNVTSTKSVFNIDVDHDVLLQITVEGGRIIDPANIGHLDVLRKIDKNGSTIIFTEGKEGYIKIVTSSEYTNSEGLNTPTGSASFVKVGYENGKNVYSLVSTSLTSFVPKMSVTLYRNLVMNVYVPASGLEAFVLDGISYNDLGALAGATVVYDGVTYYHIPIELSSAVAAREIVLKAAVSKEGTTANVTFTFSVPKYAQKVIANGSEVEKTLVRDVLRYVKSAYNYFDTDDKAALSKIDEILGSYTSAPVIEGSTDSAVEGFKEVTLVLDGTPSIRFYLENGADVSNYVFYAGGKRLNTEIADDGSYIDIDAYAYALCETISCTVDGDTLGSYHVNSYYAYVSGTDEGSYNGDDKAALTDLTMSFWRYLQSARAYRTSVIGS